MPTITTAVRNATLDKINTDLSAGAAAPHLKIRTGSKPAGPATTATGTLLADVTLNDPAFDPAASGSMALDVAPAVADASADATGTAGWARFEDSDGNGVVDVTVTATGGGGELTFASVSFVSGVAIGITSYTLTMPAS